LGAAVVCVGGGDGDTAFEVGSYVGDAFAVDGGDGFLANCAVGGGYDASKGLVKGFV